MINRAAALFARAQGDPNKTALLFEGTAISFSDLATSVRATAGGLARIGIRQGSHVGVLLRASPEFIIIQQALFALGAVVTPLNTYYRPVEVQRAVACCDLSYVITTADFARDLSELSPSTLADCTIVTIDHDMKECGTVWLPHAVESGPDIESLAEVASDEPVMLLLTSATTGKAKGVILTAANLAANYDFTPGWLGLNRDTVILCALPLYNTFGLNQCINAMLVTGATLVLLPKFDAERCIAAIAEHRCTFLPAVPTMIQKILDHPAAGREPLRSLSRIMTGGAPVPTALLQRLADLLPNVEVLTGYGLTEATALVTLTPVTLDGHGQINRGRTIGRVLDGMTLEVLDEHGNPAPPFMAGEFAIRGPNVMAGYYRAPADTAAALSKGRLLTGDVGYLDKEGYAFLIDRKKDVIIRGGQNIYPADIEEVLYQIDDVTEAAVVGWPDDVLGEVPVAFVAVKDNGHVDTPSMLDHCRLSLAPYKLPVAIHVLNELPKGPTGKILRRALKPEKALA